MLSDSALAFVAVSMNSIPPQLILCSQSVSDRTVTVNVPDVLARNIFVIVSASIEIITCESMLVIMVKAGGHAVA